MGSYIGSLSVIALVLFPFYFLIRFGYVKLCKPQTNLLRETALAIFVISMVALLALALQTDPSYYNLTTMMVTAKNRIYSGARINLVPFRMILAFLRNFSIITFMINIMGNILMFIPLGFFPPLLWPRWNSASRIFAIGLALPLFIETAQLFLGRSTDIDDIILNLLGVFCGYLLFKVADTFFPVFRNAFVSAPKITPAV